MAQSLEVNIKTTSDVPKAMDKAKSAVTGFDKQVQDIGKKFSTAFKDIALGFVAPMVILNSLVGMISDKIAESKRVAQEGFDLIASGETQFANSEEKRFAAYLKARKAREDEMQSVKEGKVEVTQRFADTKEGARLGIQLAEKYKVAPEGMNAFFKNLANIPEYQKKAMEWFLATPEAQSYAEKNAVKKTGDFKGPEGFSNVIGVGPNPVIEAMTQQLEEQKKQTALLEKIAGDSWAIPPDFTKSNATPSRASMLTQ